MLSLFHSSWTGRILLVVVLAFLSFAPTFAHSTEATPTAGAAPSAASGSILVYHQLSNVTHQTTAVGYPVLSADGTRAVFVDAPGTGDPAVPNRIYVMNTDGTGVTEVDAYQTGCYCGSQVDISADGETVVSTESVHVRLVRGSGAAQTLVALTSNELSSVRLTAAGDRVFFVLGRDTQVAASTDVLERGIYVVDADGTGRRQVIGPRDVADVLGVTADMVGMGRGQVQVLDISADGARLIFAAYVGAEMAVFTAQDDGSNLRRIAGPVTYAPRVAISGDGSTVAYDVVPLNTHSDNNEVWVVPFTGGEPQLMATRTFSGWNDPVQLTDDGSRLLVSPNSLLIDTETGETRQLAVPSSSVGGNHDSVLTDGLPRATMNADATRFLYAMRTSRCADCVNLHEQLAVLDLAPTELGEAPLITNLRVEPASIPLNYIAAATVQAEISSSGDLLGVGLVALRDGVVDGNVAAGVILVDDGTTGDQTAGDGIFTNNNVVHVMSVAREDDTGPRMLRVEAEIETSTGFRHATAVEVGPLMVVAD